MGDIRCGIQASGLHYRQPSMVEGQPIMYSICFSGIVRTGTRCELCLSLSHPTRDCTLVSDPDPDVTTRLKTLESAVLAMTSHPSRQQGPPPISMSPDTCRNWNAGKCRMLNCRYKHVCRVCGRSNPAYACCDRMLGPRPSIVPTVEGQRSSSSARFGPGPSRSDNTPFGVRRSGPGPQQATNTSFGPKRPGRIRQDTTPY